MQEGRFSKPATEMKYPSAKPTTTNVSLLTVGDRMLHHHSGGKLPRARCEIRKIAKYAIGREGKEVGHSRRRIKQSHNICHCWSQQETEQIVAKYAMGEIRWRSQQQMDVNSHSRVK